MTYATCSSFQCLLEQTHSVPVACTISLKTLQPACIYLGDIQTKVNKMQHPQALCTKYIYGKKSTTEYNA